MYQNLSPRTAMVSLITNLRATLPLFISLFHCRHSLRQASSACTGPGTVTELLSSATRDACFVCLSSARAPCVCNRHGAYDGLPGFAR
ncbi:hypothetical protein PoB_004656400 [Plakobranchus ocellatus]|uniref:Secreted protein n=1 Tax=Plakobranchus ocellatus TaxID=259542 RepID=A0AAV4BIX7_9GAST|nr:hypothetical protein PoB_004656400 [Plakobranchus ocellatus]